MPHEVFISYSSQDKAVADAACAALEAEHVRCWVAPRDILAGTEYGEAIVSAIEDCCAMVLIFSAHANGSVHVRKEVERAVSKGKFILPFRIDNILPSRAMEYCLSNTHWLDALTPPLAERIDELVSSVVRLLSKDTASTTAASATRQVSIGMEDGAGKADHLEIWDRQHSKILWQGRATVRKGQVMTYNLVGQNLADADLRGVDLYSSNLTKAVLSNGCLQGAMLQSVCFVCADLRGADLTGANLFGADLARCDLREANLTGASLACANLRASDLRNADLTAATLQNAILNGALYSEHTRWPEGFDPEKPELVTLQPGLMTLKN